MKQAIKNKKLIRSQGYIDGQWVDGVQGKTFEVLNPFDQKLIAKVPDMEKKMLSQPLKPPILRCRPGVLF